MHPGLIASNDVGQKMFIGTVSLQKLRRNVSAFGFVALWKHPSSSVARKFKVQQSSRKLMATIFWDSEGVLLVDFTPRGHSQCRQLLSNLERAQGGNSSQKTWSSARGCCLAAR